MRRTYTLTDGGLVDLDGVDAGGLEVDDLVTESQSKLLGLELTGDIGTGERPVEDGDWASQHALHGELGQALGVRGPLDSDGSGTADVGDDNWGTDVTEQKR